MRIPVVTVVSVVAGVAVAVVAISVSACDARAPRQGEPAVGATAPPAEAEDDVCRRALGAIWDARAGGRADLLAAGARPFTRETYVAAGATFVRECAVLGAEGDRVRTCLIETGDPRATRCGLDDTRADQLERSLPALAEGEITLGEVAPIDEAGRQERLRFLQGTWRAASGETWTVDREGGRLKIEHSADPGAPEPAARVHERAIAPAMRPGRDGDYRFSIASRRALNLERRDGAGSFFTVLRAGPDTMYAADTMVAHFVPVASIARFTLSFRHGTGDVAQGLRGLPALDSRLFYVFVEDGRCRALDLAGNRLGATCEFRDDGGERLFDVRFRAPGIGPIDAVFAVADEDVFVTPEFRAAGRFVRVSPGAR